jgi:undecaprenyl-diphosphatase
LLAFAGVVQQVMTGGRLVTFDRRVANRIAHHQFLEIMIGRVPLEGRWVEPSRDVTVLGDARFLLAVALVAGTVLWIMWRPRAALFVVGATVGGMALDLVVRSYIGAVRPDIPSPFTFASQDGMPSGHALDATVCFGAIVIVLFPRLPVLGRIVAVLAATTLVLVVSASRVTLLAHYVSDVVGGVTLGLAWLFALAAVFMPWRERSERAYDSRGSGASVSI